MGRYSKDEELKIDYLKLRIKELRYLNFVINKLQNEIDEVDLYLTKISNPSNVILEGSYINSYSIDGKLNKLLDKKTCLEKQRNYYVKEKDFSERILNALPEPIDKIAHDLFVLRYTSSKIMDLYFVSNPYQSINDELRYLEVDSFLSSNN